ncbi:MAG: nucleoside phosphorylase [Acidocella sp.]|nr:nucleoside phosphorylase [Acidocella sp.]
MNQSATIDQVWSLIEPMQSSTPILDSKDHHAPSVFLAENMLREARRQKNLAVSPVPNICILDPDGDLVSQLQEAGRTAICESWACYHTKMYEFQEAGIRFGIIGCAVGAAFSVLLAEQAFASGCELLISLSSAGQIIASERVPYFILIERALRDEGTSYHYLAPSRYAQADATLTQPVLAALLAAGQHVHPGATWTTDAPFRETEAAIAAARREGILAVEMEAAALYAFAKARGKKVLCFAQVTNQMGQIEGDFEKGEANSADSALTLIAIAGRVAMEIRI